MEIANTIAERVKDVVALSKNVAKVVKEEVELYFDQKEAEKDEEEDEDYDYDYDEMEDEDSKTIFEYFEDFESKFRDLVENAFSKFNFSKSEEQEELEARIAALEEKLSKLVEDSLEALRKDKEENK